jgi:predicted helicase
MAKTFGQIIEKYRLESLTERSKGDKFEQIIKAYFFTDPKYSDSIEHIWLWDEFPYRSQFGIGDAGIDLVIQMKNSEYWAVQCKCVAEGTYIDKPAVDSFMTISSRSFETQRGDIYKFAKRVWVSTTNNWSNNATESLKNQIPSVTRINLYDLETAPVDWEKLENLVHGVQARTELWDLKPHQQQAVDDAIKYFKRNERGKFIMACGTGKTFTTLRLAEKFTQGKGIVLFLVPSISLLSQTLREWTAQAKVPIDPICICSDPKVSKDKKISDDTTNFSVIDLALPASTNIQEIKKQLDFYSNKKNSLKVVFSTYQSIDVIAKAQKEVGFEFELTICDEAHRTTGATRLDEAESAFVKVHDNEIIKSKKRLYMTATPRLYSEDAKTKAAQASIEIASMDDKKKYGEEIYRIGFSEAVEKNLLSDYKVLILTLSENEVPKAVQEALSHSTTEISTDDASRLVGCINALSKHIIGDGGTIDGGSKKEIMRRAVAFTPKIKDSKKITELFNEIGETYKNTVSSEKKKSLALTKSKHIDGTMDATQRDQLMAWLKAEADDDYESRILTNVRCLSEGVDVPSLDAVMFLSAKNSQVDVVQSVGRVMRKSPGKKYGYIIIPVVIPDGIKPEEALNDNERYKVVWTVLNALRAHDDRFNATINKIDLNKKRPKQIIVGTSDNTGEGDEPRGSEELKVPQDKQLEIYTELQNAIFAKLVEKVGEREYWGEQWAKEVESIVKQQIVRITRLVNENGSHQQVFNEFLVALHKNINPSLTKIQAIEILAQHIITKPIFEALFEGYSFSKNNVVSVSMQNMVDLIEALDETEDTSALDKFYSYVKRRASGIDNSEAKQNIIKELYETFFKAAFPKMVEKLGIVFTPVEVIDFIIHSVDDVLKKEFNRSLTDENVHILDPFTGTGTFITRLLQSGLIETKDLKRKYEKEIFANEIVLLAYYIAAVNIENTYHDLSNSNNYESFEGIALTDTFQLNETQEDKLFPEVLAKNSERVERQKNTPIQVIIGNPPYSIGQKSANDNSQNQKYPTLDARIASTYAKLSSAGLNKSLYDAYIKAFRWSTDRLDKTGGIIAFVSNGAWLDGNSTDGFRKSIEKEFTAIYVFNLRGNARTSGEQRRKEKGNIFGEGSRTPIAITLLVKNPDVKTEKATIHYHDIGDYLDQKEKLKIVSEFKIFTNPQLPLNLIHPNIQGDWLNFRNDAFETYSPVSPLNNLNPKSKSFFIAQSLGTLTGRDAWVSNFSLKQLQGNIGKTIKHYNEQRELLSLGKINEPQVDSTKGSWSQIWLDLVRKNYFLKEEKNEYRVSQFRPFVKTNCYFGKDLNARRYQLSKLFPTNEYSNLTIVNTGVAAGKPFSVLIVNNIPNYDFIEKSNCLPLYYYEENKDTQKGMFDDSKLDFIRRDAISDFILERAQSQYGDNTSKEDIFYYVYGFLHSPEYRNTFANDLKKMLPRIPLIEAVGDFWKFSIAGRKLAELHINYESVPPYLNVKLSNPKPKNFIVTKMKFPKKGQKDTIIYNSDITISNIPAKAYEYVVNGKSAIEWIMERYQIKVDKASGIKNDPNDWAKETKNPQYIFNLLLSIINVSIKTVDIVNTLPKLSFDTKKT